MARTSAKSSRKSPSNAPARPTARPKRAGGTRRAATRRPATRPDRDELENLLLQSLETEQAGLEVYDMAIRCAEDPDLREEWIKYRSETREHERILYDACDDMGIDPGRMTPERELVRRQGRDLVALMERAFDDGTRTSAQLVAAECVVHAETRDHLNWSLLGEAAKALEGRDAEILLDAYGKVEQEEDAHLYHTMGWLRELWLDALGLPAVLPPPEERLDVRSATGAARAKSSRGLLAREGGTGGTKGSKDPKGPRSKAGGKRDPRRGARSGSTKGGAKAGRAAGHGGGRRVPPGVRNSLGVTAIRTNETATNPLRAAMASGIKPQRAGPRAPADNAPQAGKPQGQAGRPQPGPAGKPSEGRPEGPAQPRKPEAALATKGEAGKLATRSERAAAEPSRPAIGFRPPPGDDE